MRPSQVTVLLLGAASAAAAAAEGAGAADGAGTARGAGTAGPPNFTVAAYLPEWRYDAANFERICRVVTHLIFFSLEVQHDGLLGAMERIPRRSLREEARTHCQKMLICVGGNGRSAGFSAAVSTRNRRRAFINALLSLCQTAGLDGVDINWEYPGYRFGHGYQDDDVVARDYRGLGLLLKEAREAFRPSGRLITLAYYPDGRQERMLAPMAKYVDAMHIMAYDQGGRHSTYEFAQQVAQQAVAILPPSKVTLGMPFYGRSVSTGDWKSYEDLLKPADFPDGPVVSRNTDETRGYYFNGPATIARKTRLAISLGLQGVMIWEIGQDCREAPIIRRDKVAHVQTCPSSGPATSLLSAIEEAIPRRRHIQAIDDLDKAKLSVEANNLRGELR